MARQQLIPEGVQPLDMANLGHPDPIRRISGIADKGRALMELVAQYDAFFKLAA